MSNQGPAADVLLGLYERMQRCRQFEEHVRSAVKRGELPGFVHLSVGEEAVAAGVCQNLRTDDWIVSTHRGHGHLLAKGMSAKKMMAELYGRTGGASQGKGGSMHMADPSIGVLGTNGVVGAGLAMSNGPALSAKTRRTDQVSVCFFGDGASNQGTFGESLNFAAILDLPTIFVLENNLYGETSAVEYTHRVKEIAQRAVGYGLPGATVDGMDAVAVYAAAGEAVDRARAGDGPTLIECMTYRYYGHYEGDPDNYRAKEEIEEYRARDPIPDLEEQMIASNVATRVEIRAIDEQVADEVREAVDFARNSPHPLPEDCLPSVFAESDRAES